MTKQPSVSYFVQQRPHHDRRVIAITCRTTLLTLASHRFSIEGDSANSRAPSVLRRPAVPVHRRRSSWRGKDAPQVTANGIQPQGLHVQNVTPKEIFVVGSCHRHWIKQNCVKRPMDVNAAAIQTEVAAFKPEVAETAAHRILVYRNAARPPAHELQRDTETDHSVPRDGS